MPQRGFVVEQNPLNTAMSWPIYRDWPKGFFARLHSVTIKSLRGTLISSHSKWTLHWLETHIWVVELVLMSPFSRKVQSLGWLSFASIILWRVVRCTWIPDPDLCSPILLKKKTTFIVTNPRLIFKSNRAIFGPSRICQSFVEVELFRSQTWLTLRSGRRHLFIFYVIQVSLVCSSKSLH